MTTVKDTLKTRLINVGVFRDSFPVARYYFDIHLDEDGIAGYFMWRRNLWRVPIVHPIKENMIRRSRNGNNRQEEVEKDSRNFFIAFEDIQGVVNDTNHKEVIILSSQEQIMFIFRPLKDYQTFLEHVKAGASDKIFSRDDVEVNASVYIS